MANQKQPYGSFPKMPYKPGTGTTKTMPYTPGTGGTAKTMPSRPKKAASPWMEKPKQANVRQDIYKAIDSAAYPLGRVIPVKPRKG